MLQCLEYLKLRFGAENFVGVTSWVKVKGVEESNYLREDFKYFLIVRCTASQIHYCQVDFN